MFFTSPISFIIWSHKTDAMHYLLSSTQLILFSLGSLSVPRAWFLPFHHGCIFFQNLAQR